jgi:1,4-alpha-glucan branching enzyme
MKSLVRDLNRLYVNEAALHELDFFPEGFQWIDCHDADQSVMSWLRRGRDGRHAVVVLNFTPVPRHGYRLGVPLARGLPVERINTDSAHYGGSDLGNGGASMPSESLDGLPRLAVADPAAARGAGAAAGLIGRL